MHGLDQLFYCKETVTHKMHKSTPSVLVSFSSPTHPLVAYSISRETGRRTCVMTITGHSAKANTRFVAFLHSPRQSSPALMLISTILLHPPPTPAHVEMNSMSPLVNAVILQWVHWLSLIQ